MSALPPKADIGGVSSDVRFVPIADVADAAKYQSYSITLSTSEQLIRHLKAEGLGGLEAEVELEFCRLLQLKPSA